MWVCVFVLEGKGMREGVTHTARSEGMGGW